MAVVTKLRSCRERSWNSACLMITSLTTNRATSFLSLVDSSARTELSSNADRWEK